jgi:hypothetical protein
VRAMQKASSSIAVTIHWLNHYDKRSNTPQHTSDPYEQLEGG